MTTTQKQHVPALQFPEFKTQSDEEWEVRKLSSFNTVMQSGLSRLLKDEDVGLPVIRSNNIIENRLDISEIKYWYRNDPQGASTEKYHLDEGDLLVNFINSIAQIGKVALYENTLCRDAILTTNIMRLKFTPEIESKFIFYFCGTRHYKSHIHAITKPAVNQASFTTKDLGMLTVAVPPLPEQQKIASFLSSVDRKIEQLGKKRELLQQYKKGMMQKLFSQQIRFKDNHGNDFPDWEEKRLGEVFEEVNDKVGQQDLETYSITAGRGFISQKEKFGRDISGQQNEKYTALKNGQFSYNKGNSKTYKYGCVYLNETEKVIAVPNVFISFELLDNSMSAFYFAKLFEYHYLDRGLRQIISSSARMDGLLNVNKKYFFQLKIPVPTCFEQQRIADFLSSLDRKIDLTTTELEHAQTFKKGLLQQMFV